MFQFNTMVENGYILIPDEYKMKVKNKIKVIIINDEQTDFDMLFPPIVDTSISVEKTDLLSPPSLKTKGWKFDREMANER